MKRSLRLLAFLPLALAACGWFGKSDDHGRAKTTPSASVPQVQPIPPARLVSLLPQLDGWQRSEPEGSLTGAGQQQLSRAAARYSKNVEGKPASFTVEILDGTHVPAVNSRLGILYHSVEDVHTMKLQVAGHSGVQKWSTSPVTVNAVIVVANRFVVGLSGNDVSPEMLTQAMQGVGLKQLEALAAKPGSGAAVEGPGVGSAPMP